MARTLTTANSSFSLQIENLFPTGVNIHGYATDDMFSTGEIDTTETMMGTDGKLSGGFIFVERTFSFVLQADSESNDVVDAWIAAQENAKEVLLANATIILTGTGSKYAMTRGFLGSYSPMAASKKVLQPRTFTIKFQSISKAPV